MGAHALARYAAGGDRGLSHAATGASASSSSAIWIAFSAAPLRRLSPPGRAGGRYPSRSRRIRPISTSSTPAASPGVGNSLEADARRRPEQLRRLLGRERLDGLDPHGLGVSDHDRHADARRRDRQVGELEDLPRLGAELRLLVELLAVELPVHREVVLAGGVARSCSMRWRPRPTPTGRSRAARARGRPPRAAASTHVSGIVQQFGFAMMPSCSSARPPFTSGTTSGIPG